MKKQVNIDALNNHLFETIEMLKNSNDPNASANEKIDIPTAKAIADLAGVVVEGYKVKAQVMQMLQRTENPTIMSQMAIGSGIIEAEQITDALTAKK